MKHVAIHIACLGILLAVPVRADEADTSFTSAPTSTREVKATRKYPLRRGGVTDLATSALAFMSLTNTGGVDCSGAICFSPAVNGGGGLFTGSVVHHFDAPVLVGGSIEPVGFGFVTPMPDSLVGSSTTPVFVGSVFGALDTRLVEAGAGVGGATLGDGTTDLMIVTRARIGATDGLNLRGTLGFVVPHASVQGPAAGISLLWAFGLQVPLTQKLAFESDLKFGDGAVGDGLVGLRYRVAGDGGHGTVGLTTQVGIAIVNGSTTYAANGFPLTFSSGGPAIALGVDWRL